MRRLILIIIATAFAGKLFALIISSIAQPPSQKIKGSLLLEKMTQEQIRLNKVDQRKAPQIKKGTYTPFAKALKVAMVDRRKMQKDREVALAKKAAVEKAEADKDRRKKRRKKLENMAKKKTQEPQFTLIQDEYDEYETQRSNPYSMISLLTATSPQATKAKAGVPGVVPQVKIVNLEALTQQLLSNPTYPTMVTLINHYREHRISQAEYYNVVNQLQQSSNVNARRLAVMGSSMETEQNLDAFQVLSKETLDEDTSARDAANHALRNNFANPNLSGLTVMSEALVGGVLVSKIVASNILGEVATAFQSSPNPEQTDLFRPFVDILAPYTVEGTDPQLLNSATATLRTIQEILRV